MRLWRIWKTRERRATIAAARAKRLKSEQFDRNVRALCVRKGRNPDCLWERTAAAWQLAAEAWARADEAWKRVI